MLTKIDPKQFRSLGQQVHDKRVGELRKEKLQQVATAARALAEEIETVGRVIGPLGRIWAHLKDAAFLAEEEANRER